MSRITFNIALAAFLCTVIAAGSLVLFGQVFYDILVDERYHQGLFLLPFLAISAGLQVCHHILGLRISALKKTNVLLAPQIISALVFTLAVFIGAICGGMLGVAFSLVISSAGYCIWMYIISEFYINKSIYEINDDGVGH